MCYITCRAGDAELQVKTGRKLLAATDDRFNFYTQQYPNKNVMVCKRCDATNLQGATVAGDNFQLDNSLIAVVRVEIWS